MAQLELVHPAPLDLDAPLSPRADHNVIAQFVGCVSGVGHFDRTGGSVAACLYRSVMLCPLVSGSSCRAAVQKISQLIEHTP